MIPSRSSHLCSPFAGVSGAHKSRFSTYPPVPFRRATSYTRYTSTLEEAWRISIVELTKSVATSLAVSVAPWELGPDDAFIDDPIAAFGVLEAQKHRSRGITLGMFMGLMKYYRQAYLDLVHLSFPLPLGEQGQNSDHALYASIIARVFDRIEIAFCTEWSRSETADNAIVELQTANRYITNEKNKFLTIFESLPIAVFLLDDYSRIMHMNHVAARLIDQSATSGGHYYSTPERRIPFPWLAEELSRVQGGSDEKDYECKIRLPDGTDCLVQARFHQMQDISFKYPGTVVILTDITARKKAEEELKLAQSQLLQSEKMASIGVLAAGVAHEINNPVGFVNSNFGTLRKYVDDLLHLIGTYEQCASRLPSQKDAFKEVEDLKQAIDFAFEQEDAKSLLAESQQGIDRVKKIVQDLKDFSHVDAEDKWNEEDIHRGIESTLTVIWNELKYTCDVKKDYGDLPPVECLLSQLNQVFMNLLVNAAHAVETKGIITIRTGTQDDHVWIEITDNGKGIPPENLKRIFEPFFTTKPVGKGTGLGLTVSYHIVQKHHGRMEVEGEPGKGTTFRVWLPVKQPDASANE
jgi:PAS domain S-box-containing protein